MLHYLDKFLFVGRKGFDNCSKLLDAFSNLMNYFGVPLAEEKMVHPCHCLDFLGITIDTVSVEFCLPTQKLLKIADLIDKFMLDKKVLLKDLQLLLGMLVFTIRVIPMGRIFAKKLYFSIKVYPYSHIRLTKPLKEDLRIWSEFLSNFNGHYLWQSDFIDAEALGLFTDAAGSKDFGAFWNGHWSAECWDQSRIDSVVVNLLRFLVLYCFKANIWLKARHLPGSRNVIADSHTRCQMDRFPTLAPMAGKKGLDCPKHLWTLIWNWRPGIFNNQ
ncbi:unnamed protein product [Ranitomeya imitator]|uniref:Reverse transcriptase domain-containing protein n=1 Tax=Ranitomeya imitator TaxID=111125 RepID=A0ABN9KSF5_9NEOB|nr:unnamed protein product [Ranitomeya imitator]